MILMGIVQLPLPKHIDENKVTLSINPNKDVDGFILKFWKKPLGMKSFIPATPFGIIELLDRYQIKTSGKRYCSDR